VDWLRGCGLVLGDGVSCEASLFTVGAEDVVVTGDIARWPKLRFDDLPRRVEHWLNAVEQGRAAAENLMLGPALRDAALDRPPAGAEPPPCRQPAPAAPADPGPGS
jgi:NADPH-dependent 2,4-dienoyl-CoA reductase/sulfur reductase-like enzyme